MAEILKLLPNGGYRAPEGSPFSDMTKEEVADAQASARKTKPCFKGPHNAPWEQHHPVMRAEWESMGHGPDKPHPDDSFAEVEQAVVDNAKAKKIEALKAQLAALGA
jgi:hypothetical protein